MYGSSIAGRGGGFVLLLDEDEDARKDD